MKFFEENVACPGQKNESTFWLFPILTNQTEMFLQALWARGIQALPGDSVHTLVPGAAPKAKSVLNNSILLPLTHMTPKDGLKTIFKEVCEINYSLQRGLKLPTESFHLLTFSQAKL